MIGENVKTAKTLWFTPDKRHFYIISAAAEVRVGPLELVSLGGEHRRVNVDDVEPHKISRERAASVIRGATGEGYSKVREVIGRMMGTEGDNNPMPDNLDRLFDLDLGELLTAPKDAARDAADKVKESIDTEAIKDSINVDKLSEFTERVTEQLRTPEVTEALSRISASFDELGSGLAELARGIQRGAERVRDDDDIDA